MKKIFNFICGLMLVVFAQSCEPMEDTYEAIDKDAIDQSGVKEIELGLATADYNLLDKVAGAENIKANQVFLTEDEAKEFIPAILAKKYPYLGEKSAINVTYDLGNKSLTLSTPIELVVTDAIYEQVTKRDDGSFFKNFNSDAQILSGIHLMRANPEHGDYVKITYMWNPTKQLTTTGAVYFNGIWRLAYTLVAADYTAMEQSFPNFSTKEAANAYIPTFIGLKFPYSNTEGQQKTILYDYSRFVDNVRTTTTELLLVQYLNREWVVNNGTQKSIMKFSFTKGQWVPDNTIKYTITTDEHKKIIAPFVENEAAKASITQYGNFDLRLFDNYGKIIEYLGLFTKSKFPDAVVGQRYLLTYRTHNPSGTATAWLVLDENGTYQEVKE